MARESKVKKIAAQIEGSDHAAINEGNSYWRKRRLQVRQQYRDFSPKIKRRHQDVLI